MNLNLKSIISSVVIGGLLITSGSAVFASTTDSSTPGTQQTEASQVGSMTPGGMPGDMHGGRGPMGQDGMGIGQDGIKTLTESLVKEGIITQEVADKMVSYASEKDTERKAEMEKVKSMTDEERKAYLESKKDAGQAASNNKGKSGQYADMVTAGILTQDQADAINKYFEEQQQEKRQEALKKQLDSLVTDSTITQDQEDKIITYLEQQDESRKAEMEAEREKVKSMTDDERKAYFESKKDAKYGNTTSLLQGLIDDGTLTQTQADAVAKVLTPNNPGAVEASDK